MNDAFKLPLQGLIVLELGHTVMGPTCGLVLAEKAGIPFAPVARPQDLFEDYHLNQAGCLVETSLPHGGQVKLPKIPLRMDKKAFELRNHAPKVGEGSLSFLKQIGFSEKEINELVQGKILDLKEY